MASVAPTVSLVESLALLVSAVYLGLFSWLMAVVEPVPLLVVSTIIHNLGSTSVGTVSLPVQLALGPLPAVFLVFLDSTSLL